VQSLAFSTIVSISPRSARDAAPGRRGADSVIARIASAIDTRCVS